MVSKRRKRAYVKVWIVLSQNTESRKKNSKKKNKIILGPKFLSVGLALIGNVCCYTSVYLSCCYSPSSDINTLHPPLLPLYYTFKSIGMYIACTLTFRFPLKYIFSSSRSLKSRAFVIWSSWTLNFSGTLFSLSRQFSESNDWPDRTGTFQ